MRWLAYRLLQLFKIAIVHWLARDADVIIVRQEDWVAVDAAGREHQVRQIHVGVNGDAAIVGIGALTLPASSQPWLAHGDTVARDTWLEVRL